MQNRLCWFLMLFIVFSGCASESPKEKYDAAVRGLEKAQATLDSLRPGYDAARITAMNATCREIAGTTPEESASAALQGLGTSLDASALPADPNAAAAKKTEEGKKVAGRKSDELDKTIDGLIAAQKNVQEKNAALTGPMMKANETMAKIKTPGTPEAKKYEEKLAAMPEVKSFERQQKRVDAAQKEVDELKSQLDK
jgi:hypothetical protein